MGGMDRAKLIKDRDLDIGDLALVIAEDDTICSICGSPINYGSGYEHYYYCPEHSDILYTRDEYMALGGQCPVLTGVRCLRCGKELCVADGDDGVVRCLSCGNETVISNNIKECGGALVLNRNNICFDCINNYFRMYSNNRAPLSPLYKIGGVLKVKKYVEQYNILTRDDLTSNEGVGIFQGKKEIMKKTKNKRITKEIKSNKERKKDGGVIESLDVPRISITTSAEYSNGHGRLHIRLLIKNMSEFKLEHVRGILQIELVEAGIEYMVSTNEIILEPQGSSELAAYLRLGNVINSGKEHHIGIGGKLVYEYKEKMKVQKIPLEFIIVKRPLNKNEKSVINGRDGVEQRKKESQNEKQMQKQKHTKKQNGKERLKEDERLKNKKKEKEKEKERLKKNLRKKKKKKKVKKVKGSKIMRIAEILRAVSTSIMRIKEGLNRTEITRGQNEEFKPALKIKANYNVEKDNILKLGINLKVSGHEKVYDLRPVIDISPEGSPIEWLQRPGRLAYLEGNITLTYAIKFGKCGTYYISGVIVYLYGGKLMAERLRPHSISIKCVSQGPHERNIAKDSRVKIDITKMTSADEILSKLASCPSVSHNIIYHKGDDFSAVYFDIERILYDLNFIRLSIRGRSKRPNKVYDNWYILQSAGILGGGESNTEEAPQIILRLTKSEKEGHIEMVIWALTDKKPSITPRLDTIAVQILKRIYSDMVSSININKTSKIITEFLLKLQRKAIGLQDSIILGYSAFDIALELSGILDILNALSHYNHKQLYNERLIDNDLKNELNSLKSELVKYGQGKIGDQLQHRLQDVIERLLNLISLS